MKLASPKRVFDVGQKVMLCPPNVIHCTTPLRVGTIFDIYKYCYRVVFRHGDCIHSLVLGGSELEPYKLPCGMYQ